MTVLGEYSIELKLKLLHFYEVKMTATKSREIFTLVDDLWRRFFLNILYSIMWKRVLSSKYSNRIVVHYFQRLGYILLDNSRCKVTDDSDFICEFTLGVVLLYYLNDINFDV